MKPLRGVILDVDGTLVDSNEAHIAAWVDALRQSGYDVSPDTIRPLIGMGSDTLLPAAVGIEKATPEGQRLSKLHSRIFESEYLPRVEAFPCTHELLQHMRARGLRLVLASAAKGHIMDTLLDLAGAECLIEDDPPPRAVHSSKPDPEIVQAALDRLGYARDEVVMIGDTPYDIAAAAQLGIPVIAVRCGGYADADLAGALALYDDPADLLAHYAEVVSVAGLFPPAPLPGAGRGVRRLPAPPRRGEGRGERLAGRHAASGWASGPNPPAPLPATGRGKPTPLPAAGRGRGERLAARRPTWRTAASWWVWRARGWASGWAAAACSWGRRRWRPP